MATARFQNNVNITPLGAPQYLAGDQLGSKNLWNPAQGAVVYKDSSIPQAIASFTWRADTGVCAPLKADSPTSELLGFVARTQDTSWNNADVDQGWSMSVAPGYQLQYFSTGTFAAVVPSLNNGGVGPILYGDLVLISNTTGLLVSQTSSTIPSGYSQCITNGVAWRVIDTTAVYDAEGSQLQNLCAISNIQSSL